MNDLSANDVSLNSLTVAGVVIDETIQETVQRKNK